MTAAVAVAPRRKRHQLTLVESEVLGPMTLLESSLIEFPRGLFGFPECRRYALLAVEDRVGMYWLQSLDSHALTFVLIDPFLAADDYEVDVPDVIAHELHADRSADLMILAIVTLPTEPHARFTANLQGPLAINPRAGIAAQLVLADSEFGTRVPIDLSRCR